MTFETTLDGMLNRRVALEQPAQGYRVAVDTVFLAAAVEARMGQRVLDMGCGVGGAFLALACRVAGLSGVGVDAQDVLVDICRRNIGRNPFAAGFVAQTGDVTCLDDTLCGVFDHVLMNPPYHEEDKHDVSPNAVRRKANTENSGDLGLWIAQASKALAEGGSLTLIHRADRYEEILTHLATQGFGAVSYLFLLSKAGGEAKRVVVRAQYGKGKGALCCAPLALHQETGGYTPEADAVLREARALPFI